MTIIYVISKYLTIIGTSLKAFWEQLFCRILQIPVQDASYLSSTELCGHIEHEFTESKVKSFLLCYLPGAMNRFFGYGMLIGGYLGLFYLEVSSEDTIFWVYLAMLYVGISLMCNNAPLYEDALLNWDLLYGKEQKTNIVVKILAFIPSVYFIVSALMEKYAISLLLYIVAVLVGIFVI